MSNSQLAKSIYPYTLRFTKLVKRGTFKGFRFEETLGFTSPERAQAWLVGVAANYKRKILDYVIEKSSLERE